MKEDSKTEGATDVGNKMRNVKGINASETDFGREEWGMVVVELISRR
jgi:hypothetical protein